LARNLPISTRLSAVQGPAGGGALGGAARGNNLPGELAVSVKADWRRSSNLTNLRIEEEDENEDEEERSC